MRLQAVVLFLYLSGSLVAEGSQCLSGSPKNRLFKRALETSSAPMVVDFRNSLGLSTTNEGRIACVNSSCGTRSNSSPVKLPSPSEIPKECIKASLKRKIRQTSIECRRQPNGDWNFVRHHAKSSRTPCIDDSSVDYIHHVTNKVISCFNGLPMKGGAVESIDPKLLFSKINNESGFNFTFSYVGGVGSGQLTDDAVQEMNILNPSRTGGKKVKGHGRFILDNILASNRQECQVLKPTIANDLKFKYHSPRRPNCEWVSMETGLVRNMIYSIGYFSFLKHQIIGKEVKRRNPLAYQDKELMDLLTLTSYQKPSRGLALARSAGTTTQSINRLKEQIKKGHYLHATAQKLKEVKRFSGDSCQLL